MDYHSPSTLKKDLIEEINSRRSIGRVIDVPDSAEKKDLIAALELDDQSSAETSKFTEPEPPPVADVDPLDDLPGEAPDPFADLPATPSDVPANTEYKGAKTFRNVNDGEIYALVIKEDAPDGKTHFLKNKRHFDNCTKEEFRARYDKE